MKIKNLIIKIYSVLKKIFLFLGKSQVSTIATIILAIATFYSAKVALKVAFNDSQKYLINNGFHYNYDKEKDSNYKFYSISLTNGSTDKPINLTGGFSISISTDKNFSKKSKSSTVPKISISELLNTDIFPVNLKYAEEVSFLIDEKFASYIKSSYPNRTKMCRKSKNSCWYKKFYINFCLYDTLDNKYCYILTEEDINEISKFTNGRLY